MVMVTVPGTGGYMCVAGAHTTVPRSRMGYGSWHPAASCRRLMKGKIVQTACCEPFVNAYPCWSLGGVPIAGVTRGVRQEAETLLPNLDEPCSRFPPWRLQCYGRSVDVGALVR
jgi:hypothetical protein